VQVEKAAFVEELVRGCGHAMPHTGHRAEGVRARPQVGHLAQELKAVPLLLHGIRVGVLHAAEHCHGLRLYLHGLSFARALGQLALHAHAAAGGQVQHVLFVVG
jgi:hypothetical protein